MHLIPKQIMHNFRQDNDRSIHRIMRTFLIQFSKLIGISILQFQLIRPCQVFTLNITQLVKLV